MLILKIYFNLITSNPRESYALLLSDSYGRSTLLTAYSESIRLMDGWHTELTTFTRYRLQFLKTNCNRETVANLNARRSDCINAKSLHAGKFRCFLLQIEQNWWTKIKDVFLCRLAKKLGSNEERKEGISRLVEFLNCFVQITLIYNIYRFI